MNEQGDSKIEGTLSLGKGPAPNQKEPPCCLQFRLRPAAATNGSEHSITTSQDVDKGDVASWMAEHSDFTRCPVRLRATYVCLRLKLARALFEHLADA